MWFLIFFPLCYLLGSANFSILLFRLLGRQDPRVSFSGNAGAFNIYRQAGFRWALVVLVLDMARAMGVAGAALVTLPAEFVPWAGFFLILGNRLPCFHGFRGGKGVANYLGFTLVLSPFSAMGSAAAWVVAYGIFRIPFIASFAMVLILGAGTIFQSGFHVIHAAGVGGTVLMILSAHGRNIRELRAERMKST